jgi:hypothetical protein
MRTAHLELLAMLLLCTTAWTQGTSTINGTVTDPSGAVVGGARIVAREIETGLIRETVSNANGLYVLTSLKPTRYTVTVDARGFSQFKQTGLLLRSGDIITLNVKLTVAGANESVTVVATPAQVDITSATLRQVVDSARLIDMPLNGRNAAALTVLVQGAITAPSSNADEGAGKTFPSAVVPISVNGGRSNNVSFYLDGTTAQDLLSNINQPLPFPDAVQEFDFQTSNFSAEYGDDSSGVVNVITKSGTNEFHGNAFEFVRNAEFNARNFFASTVDPLKRNQFGGTFGGPIKGSKLFFFLGYQGTRIRDSQSGLGAYVPTAADIAGDFSALLSANNPANPLGRAITLQDPTTGKAFPNNQIPISRFDPVAKNLLKYLPSSPNPNGLMFYSEPLIQDFDEYIARADYSLSSNDRLTFRINQNMFSQMGVFVPANILTYNPGNSDLSLNTMLGETHIFSATLLNDFRFGFTYIRTTRNNPPGSPNMTDLGATNLWEAPVKGFDGFNVNGSFIFGNNGQAYFPRASFDWYDTVRWTEGRHAFGFGGAFDRGRENEVSELRQNPTVTFNGNWTGASMADYFLGLMSSFGQGSGAFIANRNIAPAGFVQDTFKATAKLTINYGVRWEPSLPWHDLFHQAEMFSPAWYASGVKSQVFSNAYAGELFSGDPGMPTDGRSGSWNNFTPRFGFAYDPFGDGKTSVRGGAGLFQMARNTSFSNNSQIQSTPFSPQVSYTNPTAPVSNPYLGNVNPFPYPRPTPSNYVFVRPIAVSSWDPGHMKLQTQNVYNWNLTLEHQLGSAWLIRAAYVASRTNHIMESQQINAAVFAQNTTSATDQARRPFQPYGSIVQGTASGNGWYNGLQVTMERRMSHGFTVLANYSWSKSTDNIPVAADVSSPMIAAQITMPYNIPNFKSLDQGPSDFDHRQNFVASYVWRLPALSHASRFVREVAGGWVIAGITTAQTGGPLTLFAGTDRSLTGIGKDSVQLLSQNLYESGPCANQAPCVKWLVPSSFGLPALGTFGNLGKGALRGPGLFDTDAGIYKNFTAGELVTVQLRAEFFNIFNRANFITPSNSTAPGYSPGSLGDILSGAGFGHILAANDPRIVQLAVKISF